MEHHSRAAEFTQASAGSLSKWSQAIGISVNEITDGELTAVCN
jgi:hypothetical protein